MKTNDPRQAALLAALDPDVGYLEAYAAVEAALREVMPAGRTFSTEQLVEMLAPADNWVHGDRETLARKRIYKALDALAKHGLKSWVTLGPPERGRFGTMRRKLWRRTNPCPACNGTGIAP